MPTGTWPACPRGVDLTAYRIIQEALTNSIRHSFPASVEVRVHRNGAHLDLEVSDQQPRRSFPRRKQVDGHGLIGMRERVALYGGSLDASIQAEGGYRVKASLPIGSA